MTWHESESCPCSCHTKHDEWRCKDCCDGGAETERAILAERERCANIAKDVAIKLMGGRKRVSKVDVHVAHVCNDIAAKIRGRNE